MVLSDWFAPGIRAGGPVTSSVNFAHAMQNDFNIHVLTSDRDLGDSQAYPSVNVNRWSYFDRGISTFYCSPQKQSYRSIAQMLERSQPDFLYLNSMFSKSFTVFPLWLHLFRKLESTVVLAPRGMLRKTALHFKPIKKYGFLNILRASGIAHRIRFHATDEQERADIHRIFGRHSQVHVIGNCVRPPELRHTAETKVPGELKIISVGRIHPIKNTKLLINAAARAENRVILDLYGPIEDTNYWKTCQQAIKELPEHIRIRHRGILPAEKLQTTLDRYQLFALATAGENFGHAIYEALAAAKPVLISDQTPWRNLAAKNAGWDLSLEDMHHYTEKIDQLAFMGPEDYNQWSLGARDLATQFAYSKTRHRDYLRLFGK
jgi:glycosyltransferase involved in cell wall biosynthesis